MNNNIEPKELLEFKQQLARDTAQALSREVTTYEMFNSPPNSRRKVDFKFKNNKLGFFISGTHKLTTEAMIEKAINKEILEFREFLQINEIPSLVAGSGEITVIKPSLGGVAVCFKPNNPKISPENLDRLISLLGGYGVSQISLKSPNSSDYELLAEFESPKIATRENLFTPIAIDGFLQPTPESEYYMQQIIKEHTPSVSRMVDLFSGLGTFGLCNSQVKKVDMFDIASTQVDITKKELQRQNINNSNIYARNLMKYPLSPRELEMYEICVINPPRAGAKNQCKILSRAKPSKIIMVSCNSSSFIRDVRLLAGGGYKITAFYLVNQFLFTRHLEIVAVLERK